VSRTHESLVGGLAELVAIPSVSADEAHRADVESAAEWVCARIRAAGGEAELVDLGGKPLAIGEVKASRDHESAPTVLCYAHFDVQPPDPLELWETAPFELTERDGWLYARGVADDKSHLFMMLEAAGELATAGELPVNLRFACDGEEETGGHSVVDWLQRDVRGADAAIVLDGGMLRRDLPALVIGLRGVCYFHLTVRTGKRDLHSGMYGGAALNALHALNTILSAVVAGPDGLLPEPLRAGVAPPTPEELASWALLPDPAEEMADQGATAMDPRAIADFYVRTWAEPSLDVNGIEGGSPRLQKTVLPVTATANLSLRLAPGQESAAIVPEVERLLYAATPEGAVLDIELWSTGEPAFVSPDASAIKISQDVFEDVLGTRPVLIRTGGSIPIVAALSARGIPAVVTGFALNESNVHSPNERIPSEYLERGYRAVRELFRRLGELP